MEAKWLLLPMLAQVALTGAVYVTTYKRRVGAVKSGEMDVLYFKTKQVGEPTREVKAGDDLLLNLFEAPTLFFAACIAAIAMNSVDEVMLALASLFVLCRMLHAKEMLGANSIRKRFLPWTIGLLDVGVMWIWLTVSAFI